jgi:carbon-monoxide dehydrogenase large subunit
MEQRGLLAEWNATTGHLTVMGAAKVPFFNRRTLAQMMGLPESAVDLIENDVGGGFGARGEFYPEDFLIPFAARQVGRPVMWIEDPREHLIAMNHARQMDCEVEIACQRDGTILGLRGDVFVDLGAYIRTNGLTAPRNVAQFFSGPYRISNIRLGSSALVTNKTPTGTYRAPGRYEGSFFCERLIELAATELGIDTVEMRRRNLVLDAEMPYPLARVDPGDLYAQTECDSGDYAHALDRCLAEFGWEQKRRLQGRLIDGRYHGLAVACFIEGGGAGPKENARLELERDGSVTVYVGSAAVGQGLETVMAQIAADALGLTIDKNSRPARLDDFSRRGVRLVPLTLDGAGRLGSVRERRRAARQDSCRRSRPPGLRAGRDRDHRGLRRNPKWSLGGAGRISRGRAQGRCQFCEPPPAHLRLWHGCGAHVAVDPGTGRVELVDYLVVEDIGRIVNPLTLHGQVIGSTVQGLGGAFMENLVYDANGQLLSGNLADYLIPSATDFPRSRAISLQHRPSPTNPLGVKGAGEGGIIPVGGLMANAVANALSSLGAEPNELPLSPPRVWRLANPSQGGE